MQYTLSILIPTIDGREQCLSELVCGLIRKCGSIKSTVPSVEGSCDVTTLTFDKVEIIIAKDNRQISTGRKRNLLLSLAKNDYIVFVDDDDYLYDCYIEEIFKAIETYPDCVATKGIYTVDGGKQIEWRLSKDLPNETIYENRIPVYIRTANHLTPVKRNLALQAGFPDLSNAEDKWYSERLAPLLKTEVAIENLIYHYRYSSQNKSYT